MKSSLNILHHQDSDWQRELEFYKEELAILTSRLEEVASKNTDKEILSQVEHYQNKFVLLREQLDVLKHDINTRDEEITDLSKTRPEHIDEKFTQVNDRLLSRVKEFLHSVADTRYAFNLFLAKVM